MNNTSKIEVCEHCSGLNIGQLKARMKVKLGCIGKCSKKCSELQGKAYGFLNGEFIVTDTQDQFFAKVDALGGYIASSNRNPLVDAFLDCTQPWRDEFIVLRTLILDTPLTEELKWGQPCYAPRAHWHHDISRAHGRCRDCLWRSISISTCQRTASCFT